MQRDDRAERVDLWRVERDGSRRHHDWLAVEEPLEIRIRRGVEVETLLTTMRTPGHDAELAAGLLHAEGILTRRDDVCRIAHTDDRRVPRPLRENTLIVTLREDHPFRLEGSRRTFLMGAACGVCGRTIINDLRAAHLPTLPTDWSLPSERLFALPQTLREAQSVFERTGGLHATALFDLDGNLLALREDIGRHNAMDKIVGAEWLADRLPLSDRIALASGRIGFEIVQKCVKAGIPVLAAIGAPSSLAVDLALEVGMTLVGFLREDRFNVYSGADRLRTC